MGIRVLVNGAFGRMGQFVTKAVSEHPNLELAGQTGREYDLAQAIKDSKADVVVDFTCRMRFSKNTQTIISAGARPVIGTTGLKAEEIKILQKQCSAAKLGGVIAPNFSLGGVLVMKYAREIAKYLPNVEIIEKHHELKVDSPSGTAIRTAEMLAESVSHANAHTPRHQPKLFRAPAVPFCITYLFMPYDFPACSRIWKLSLATQVKPSPCATTRWIANVLCLASVWLVRG